LGGGEVLNQAEYEAAVQRLVDKRDKSLREHGAYRMEGFRDCVAYFKHHPDGVEAEVWSWGGKKPPIIRATEDEVLAQIMEWYA
jgi:hypothetical protein